jgi:hypothetical protein
MQGNPTAASKEASRQQAGLHDFTMDWEEKED